jgi:hypothetical protein
MEHCWINNANLSFIFAFNFLSFFCDTEVLTQGLALTCSADVQTLEPCLQPFLCYYFWDRVSCFLPWWDMNCDPPTFTFQSSLDYRHGTLCSVLLLIFLKLKVFWNFACLLQWLSSAVSIYNSSIIVGTFDLRLGMRIFTKKNIPVTSFHMNPIGLWWPGTGFAREAKVGQPQSAEEVTFLNQIKVFCAVKSTSGLPHPLVSLLVHSYSRRMKLNLIRLYYPN